MQNFLKSTLNINNIIRNCSNGVDIKSVGLKKVITLNRPKVLNALNLDMVREIYPQMKEWNTKSPCSLILIKGGGDKAFCAGGDVISVTTSAKSGGEIHKLFFKEEYQLNNLIGKCKMPFVALINGITMGGGCGLSINGKFRVSSEKTVLSMPETALGLFPDVGGSYFLTRLPHNLGMYLALTGYRLKGMDVFFSGMATHHIESKNLETVENELLNLKDDECNDSTVDKLLKKFMPKEASVEENFTLAPVIKKIESIFGADTYNGIIKNLENDNSDWSKSQLEILSKMSPTSLRITFEQLKRGKKMEHSEVFPMEYRLSQRCMLDHDFHEGCRAILIDKDRNPKWKPSNVNEVSDETVERYFSPLPEKDELKMEF
ncbi:3-hydroxyisobutyryl-CoA hydrolase, mitochondrial [Strongyloides ratti]|uniref:3-hydroxyisobutyryl-CoA hydrolase, mitochondrial n=1 Tax=Strongyloides ratti TaxID=34506 RepID=A0A090L8Q2_STRRB|nr:3-hydroxyisobutyryl-CoA hydrolase, mitochondrial [Strongyloides ratti]CEF64518.1 3-hydroxyisobutyryl-CoA hydrolase, mitochondrial [Strongyloides ratti]